MSPSALSPPWRHAMRKESRKESPEIRQALVERLPVPAAPRAPPILRGAFSHELIGGSGWKMSLVCQVHPLWILPEDYSANSTLSTSSKNDIQRKSSMSLPSCSPMHNNEFARVGSSAQSASNICRDKTSISLDPQRLGMGIVLPQAAAAVC